MSEQKNQMIEDIARKMNQLKETDKAYIAGYMSAKLEGNGQKNSAEQKAV